MNSLNNQYGEGITPKEFIDTIYHNLLQKKSLGEVEAVFDLSVLPNGNLAPVAQKVSLRLILTRKQEVSATGFFKNAVDASVQVSPYGNK